MKNITDSQTRADGLKSLMCGEPEQFQNLQTVSQQRLLQKGKTLQQEDEK